VVDHLVSGTRHSAYEFEMTLIDGSKAPLSAYQGQVSLIVNVASKCSYTDVHYRQLEHLYNKYKDQGFTVLAFPSNDFGNQEPGSPQEIEQFVRKTKGATFPLFGKVAVNGKDADPFFEFLKDKFGIKAIPWNFQKFLVDRDGQPVRQYPSQIEPLSLEADIKQLIAVAKPSS
jgi:glutathione peroxidase